MTDIKISMARVKQLRDHPVAYSLLFTIRHHPLPLALLLASAWANTADLLPTLLTATVMGMSVVLLAGHTKIMRQAVDIVVARYTES